MVTDSHSRENSKHYVKKYLHNEGDFFMNLKTLGNIIIVIGLIQTVLWIIGLVLANIFFIVAAIIITLAVLPVLYIQRDHLNEMFQYKDKIVDDERTQFINEKSFNLTLRVIIGVIAYLGLIMVALRNSYPQYLLTGIILLLLMVFAVIMILLSRAYYKRKY